MSRSGTLTLSRALARSAHAADPTAFGPAVPDKLKLCLIDFLSCCFEARDLATSRQAIAVTTRVEVELADGRSLGCALADVVPATEPEIRARLRAAGAALGAARAAEIEGLIDDCERLDDAGQIAAQYAAGAVVRATAAE